MMGEAVEMVAGFYKGSEGGRRRGCDEKGCGGKEFLEDVVNKCGVWWGVISFAWESSTYEVISVFTSELGRMSRSV